MPNKFTEEHALAKLCLDNNLIIDLNYDVNSMTFIFEEHADNNSFKHIVTIPYKRYFEIFSRRDIEDFFLEKVKEYVNAESYENGFLFTGFVNEP